MNGASRRRIAAVVRLECLTQRREPLTVLYMLVFVLLGAAFTSAGPVDLVRDRGAVPRDAAWSIMLACTALTAFGQVITTMVAATIVLRDRADRVIDLVAVTRLTEREYLIGKLVAALLLLSLIYCAVPIGLVLGAVIGGGSVSRAAVATLPPFLLLVVPTMLAVGAMQFGAGVLSGRLWVIVGLGLVLIWLWTAAASAAGLPGQLALPVLWDPFGSAPLLHATRDWSDDARTSRSMPLTYELLANRALWLGLGALVAWLAVAVGSRGRRRAGVAAAAPERKVAGAAALRPSLAIPRIRRAAVPDGVVAMARYVSRWMLRDTGWRVLAGLGAVNVGVHVYFDARTSASAAETTATALAALVTHSQLFLILMATIYAGELVWREHDERSDVLFDAQPISVLASICGKLCGAVIAQGTVIGLLATSAAIAAVLSARHLLTVVPLLTGVVTQCLGPFVLWLLISLAVHVCIRQKVAGHLLLITGWVLVVLLGRDGPGGSRAGGAPGLAAGGVIAVAALAVVFLQWRGGRPRRPWRNGE